MESRRGGRVGSWDGAIQVAPESLQTTFCICFDGNEGGDPVVGGSGHKGQDLEMTVRL